MTFNDVLEIKNGRNQKAVENPEGRYPIYGSGGIMGYADDYICDAETVVIGRKGSINNPIYVEEPFWNVDTAFGLTPNKEILLPRYLYYFCKHFDFERLNKAVTIPSLTKSDLLKIELSPPDIFEQQCIVDKLLRIEVIISLRKKELSILNEFIKARFVELFGDIIRNDKKWSQYVFSDIATSRLGKMLDAKQQTGKYRYPYLANFNVQWFRFELDNLNEMDFNEADQLEFQLKDGDLLVCEGGEIGRCAVWHNEVQPCYFQKALHRVRCNSDIVLPDYLARWFQYNCEHGGFASIEGAKATIAHLPGAKLKQLKVTVPPIKLQEEFVTFVAQVDKSKNAVQAALEKAQLLFDSLMQEYFG